MPTATITPNIDNKNPTNKILQTFIHSKLIIKIFKKQ